MTIDNSTPFEYGLEQQVFFEGSSIEAVVLGRMHDTNGHHYELLFNVQGVPTRRWFNSAALSPTPNA